MDEVQSYVLKTAFFLIGRIVLLSFVVVTLVQGIIFQLEFQSLTAVVYYLVSALSFLTAKWVHKREKELVIEI